MSEFGDPYEPAREPTLEELRKELQALRGSFSTALVLLLVFSVCVNIFIWHQVSNFNAQVSQANVAVANWAIGGAAQVKALEVWARLTDFSKTHQDFQPIINKYSQFFNAHQPAPTPTVAPVPPKK
jgi:hypothetical protein